MIDTAVILAAGSKSHQSRLIYNRPRTMLPALGKPLVVRVMDRLHRIGVQKYIVVLGEKEGSVASYLNSKWLPDVSIEYVLKRDTQPMGRILAGIAQSHPDESVMIASYNSFTHGNFPARLLKYHDLSPDDLILSGAMNSLSHAATQVMAQVKLPESDEIGYATAPNNPAEIVTSVTAPSPQQQNLVLGGIIACGRNPMQYLANLSDELKRKDSLTSIIQAYANSGQVARVARSSWVLQVSNDEDLLTLNRHLLDEKIDAHILSELPYTVKIVEPVRIDPGVSVGQGAVIGPHVYLEGGSSVGREAKVQNAIVMQRANVAAKEQVRDAIVSTRGRIALTHPDQPS